MKTSEILYGKPGSYFINMNIEEVLLSRIELAKEIVKEVLEVHYSIRESDRMNKCLTAIKDNQDALKELRGQI